MSTNNFYYNNMLYVLEDTSDEFLVEDTNYNIVSDLVNDKKLSHYLYSTSSDDDLDENRNYPAQSLLKFKTSESKKFQNTIMVQLVVRSGYYGGANYDVNIIEYDMNGYECTTNGSIEMSSKQEAELSMIFSRIEEVLSDYTTKLVQLGTFSNGEAIYKIAHN